MAEASSAAARQQQVIWEPQPRQAAFITCPADDVAFGGARGGGKSDAVIGDWISHEEQHGRHAIGLVLRRERTQLIELIERAKVLLTPLGFSFRDVDKYFVGPKGGRLRFAYLERDSDADAYQGHSYSRVYVEEAGTFPSESPINKLQATLRSGQGVKCQMKATCNPGGPGHHWVKARYHLDTHPQGMELFRTEWTNPFTGKKVEKTRLFVPSRVYDNKYLDDAYVANLYQVGSAELVRAWLEGDWTIVEGSFFPEFGARNIIEPFTVPKEWLRFRAMDWGSARPFAVGWWAVASDDHHLGDGRVIPRGALVHYREWYGSSSPNVGLKMTAEEVAHGVIGRSGDEAFAYTVVDPSMFAMSGGPSLAERMNRAGLSGVRPGDNKRIATKGAVGGWDQLRARIKGDGENPMLFVFHTCRELIRTLPALQHDADRPEDCDSSGEDHAPDMARYACMSRPYVALPVKPPPKPDEWNVSINPNGTVSYTEGFSVFNWAEARRKKRERGDVISI